MEFTPKIAFETDGQIEWRGRMLGAATPWKWVSLEGWFDLPDMQASNSDRTGQHGQYPGQQRARARTVTYTFRTTGLDPRAFTAAMAQLRALTAPAEDPTEEALIVRLHGQRWMAHARCTKRTIPTGLRYAVGHVDGALRWVATDPRLYQLPRKHATTTLATPSSGGLAFPLAFPLDFGPGPTGGRLTITNTGNAACWPTWTIHGPCPGPAITDTVTGRRLAFDPGWSVPAGQAIVLDTHARTVVYAHSGVSASNHLTRREWFPIPDDTRLGVTFTANGYQAGARLDCDYYNTSM